MLDYNMPLWRPPSEGNNLIIQATLGCSFNRCSYCDMYRTKEYVARPLEDVFADIDRAAQAWPQVHRVFLADGDALVRETDDLLAILGHLRARLPDLQRVTSYALPANLIVKSVDELTRLREAGLTLLYYGVESGSDEILKRITKGATQDIMVEGLEKARAAGMKISATVILGLGGVGRSDAHIDGTAELINRFAPNYLSTLQLGLVPSRRADFITRFERHGGTFEEQDDAGMLAEQTRLIELLAPSRPVIFRSNHASNSLPLAGVLPKDKAPLLEVLALARTGMVQLRTPQQRGL